ncbi:hypothetical protein [Saccharopolyspora elongata]|uniref:Excreted virulence factor EspC, type VII ESX diderm n=1 Tax=Saccharopolyspora elongata TaxID=2530387 RepID=A0A4R4YEL9_9PSEU|nr:hypothetical protein [Saccharopolyspora elongata]TDD42364.1 hypothetical protein E1288_29615 [Saccharopolyspora elongata]
MSSEGSTNGVRVSTEALRTFANNLRMMLDPLNAAKTQIEQVKLAPGGFWHAFDLMERVVGSNKSEAIQPNTLDFISKAIQAITITADELDGLASAYATAEELNAATGQDLGEHIENAKGYLTSAIGGATSLG